MSRRPPNGLQPWRWLGVPALLCIGATVLLGAPLRLFGFGLPEPVFPLVLAFAWGVIRPSLLGPLALLLLGLFHDLYWGAPLGLWALALILAYGVALAGRILVAGQGTEVLAVWYVGSLLLAMGSADLVTVALSRSQPSLLAMGLQFAFTALLFPVAYGLIDRFEDADIRFR